MEKALKNFGVSSYEEAGRAVAAVASDGAEALRSRLADIEAQGPRAIDPKADALLPRIEALLEGRVLPRPPSRKIRKRLARSASFRLPFEVPPDYEYGSKESPMKAAGDYLLWCEVLALAKREDQPVLFVSNDWNRDWVQFGRERGGRDQSRPELIAEFAERTSATFHQMKFGTFLSKSKILGAEVSDAILEEEGNLQTTAEVLAFWSDLHKPLVAHSDLDWLVMLDRRNAEEFARNWSVDTQALKILRSLTDQWLASTAQHGNAFSADQNSQIGDLIESWLHVGLAKDPRVEMCEGKHDLDTSDTEEGPD